MNKKKSTVRYFFSFIIFSLLVFSSADIFSQVQDPNIDQNPNVDHVPLYLKENYHPQPPIDALPVTINGFDNFNLGT